MYHTNPHHTYTHTQAHTHLFWAEIALIIVEYYLADVILQSFKAIDVDNVNLGFIYNSHVTKTTQQVKLSTEPDLYLPIIYIQRLSDTHVGHQSREHSRNDTSTLGGGYM